MEYNINNLQENNENLVTLNSNPHTSLIPHYYKLINLTRLGLLVLQQRHEIDPLVHPLGLLLLLELLGSSRGSGQVGDDSCDGEALHGSTTAAGSGSASHGDLDAGVELPALDLPDGASRLEFKLLGDFLDLVVHDLLAGLFALLELLAFKVGLDELVLGHERAAVNEVQEGGQELRERVKVGLIC